MSKSLLVALVVLSMGIAHAQQPDDERPKVFQKLQPAIAAAFPPASAQVQPVINLGDVVSNVVIAKVLGEGPDAEVVIAKFGSIGTDTVPRVVTTMQAEVRQREVIVDGEKKLENYTVNVPVSTVVHRKENFTPTEKDRSIPCDKVQAFDLKGNPVNVVEWTKRLTTPQHVLLIREPINEANKLNPFYSAILREDILLLFLKGEVVDDRIVMMVYDVKGLPVWSKDGENTDPEIFLDLIKTQVTPEAWQNKSTIRPFQDKQCLVVAANTATHRALAMFLKDMREEIAKAAK